MGGVIYVYGLFVQFDGKYVSLSEIIFFSLCTQIFNLIAVDLTRFFPTPYSVSLSLINSNKCYQRQKRNEKFHGRITHA